MPVALMLALGAQAEERSRPLDHTPDEVAYFVSFSIPEKAWLRCCVRRSVRRCRFTCAGWSMTT